MPASETGRSAARPWAWPAAVMALIAVAFAIQAYLAHNPDTSWLLFVARRTLDGAVPYRDILETNPPASFLLYMPAVALARLVGANEVAVTDALVVLATALSLTLGGSILDRARLLERSRAQAMLFGAALILLVMPMSSFAQREHIAVLASLPILAALSVRSLGHVPRPTEAILAGLGAGIAVAIKPVFALALVGPLICCLLAPSRVRPWRFVELWVTAATAMAYGVAVMLFYPDFSARVLPLVADIYLPARLDLVDLACAPTNFIWLALIGLFWQVGWSTEASGRILVAASIGFEAAALIQGKGFAYHFYPAIALAAMAGLNARLRSPAPATGRRLHGLLATMPILLLVGVSLWVFDDRYDVETHSPGLTQAIEAVSKRPRILTIGAKIALCESFARHIDARWVGSEPVAWITYFAIASGTEPKEPPRFASAIDMERSRYAADIRDQRPDAILVDGDWWMQWTRRSPALVAALSHYRDAGQFGRVFLLRRTPEL